MHDVIYFQKYPILRLLSWTTELIKWTEKAEYITVLYLNKKYKVQRFK